MNKIPMLRSVALFLIRQFTRVLFFKNGGGRNAFGSYISPREFEIRNNLENKSEIQELLSRFVPSESTIPLVRIGSKFDGGYFVIPMDWKETFILSGGIASNNEFEIWLAREGACGIEVDYSIKEPPESHANLHFIQKKIVSERKKMRKTDEISIDEILISVNFENSTKRHKLLKLDIEGFEWDCLAESNLLKCFDQIVVEFHNFHRLSSNEFRQKVDFVTKKLLKTHKSIYLSANNCCGYSIISGLPIPNVIEVTYAKLESFSVGNLVSPGKLEPSNIGNYSDRATLSTLVFWEHLIENKILGM